MYFTKTFSNDAFWKSGKNHKIPIAVKQNSMYTAVGFNKPIGNAVLTCLNNKQAKLRTKKGYEAAIAVDEVLNAK